MRYPLLYLLLAALLVRLLLVIPAFGDEKRFETPDSKDYLVLADKLLQTGTYSKGVEPEVFRAPGYPVLLAVLRFLFPTNLWPIILLQILVDTASCAILWLLARKMFPEKKGVASLAVIFQVFAISSITFNAKILSETIFTFMFMVTLLFFELFLSKIACRWRAKYLIYSGIVGLGLGLMAFVRVVALPLAPLFIIYLWLRLGKINFKRKIIVVTSFLVFFTIIYSAWSIRNSIVTGYSGFSTVSSINIYRYNACAVLAIQNNRDFQSQQKICDEKLSQFPNQIQQGRFAMKEGMKVLISSPFYYAYLHLKSDINNFFPAVGDLFALWGFQIGGKGTLAFINSHGIIPGVKHYFDRNWGLFFLALPMLLFLLLKYFLAMLGLFNSVLKLNLITHSFYLLIIAYFLMVPGLASHPRFRIPVVPLISLYAAIGLMTAINYYASKNKSRLSDNENDANAFLHS